MDWYLREKAYRVCKRFANLGLLLKESDTILDIKDGFDYEIYMKDTDELDGSERRVRNG